VRRLYFDHNASSPLRPRARELLRSWLEQDSPGNPSSAHAEGRESRRLLEDARETLCTLLGCAPEELVFTSGGTESNAWALAGRERVGVCPTDHPSILEPASRSARCELLAIDACGRVDVSRLPSSDIPFELVSVGLANHETGLVQDVAAVARGLSDHPTLLHADASQAFGRIPVDVQRLGVDLLTISAHKLGGPVGCGALVIRNGVSISPLVTGGPQEGGRRAGTESSLHAQLFAAAAAEAADLREEEDAHHRAWIERLRDTLTDLDTDSIFPVSSAETLPNTLCVVLPGRSGQALVHRLDLEGVSVSHGSACASGSLEPSPVLLSLGLHEDLARSSLRFSVGHTNTEADIDELIARLTSVIRSVPPRPSGKKSGAYRGD